MKYNIYAGLSGGFGGYNYRYTDEFESEEEAYEAARECAIEEYQSYEGYHGIASHADILKDYCESCGISEEELDDDDYGYIYDQYNEEIEAWLSYTISSIEEDPNHDLKG